MSFTGKTRFCKSPQPAAAAAAVAVCRRRIAQCRPLRITSSVGTVRVMNSMQTVCQCMYVCLGCLATELFTLGCGGDKKKREEGASV